MDAIQAIIRILEQSAGCHQELLRLEHQKGKVLVEGTAEKLVPILHEQSRLVKQIHELENERIKCTELFLDSMGLPKQPFTVSDLVKLVTSYEEKELLLSFRQQLSEQIEELSRLNRLNQKMIEQSLSFVQYTLDLITEQSDRQMTYSKGDSVKHIPGNSRSFFDTKA